MSGPRIPLSSHQQNGSSTTKRYPPQQSFNNNNNNSNSNNINSSSSSSSNSNSNHSQHDDLIKFICESWDRISSTSVNGSVLYYTEPLQPNPILRDFEPFDLEAFWGQRLVKNCSMAQQQK